MRDGVGRVGSLLVLGGSSDIGVATALALVDRGTRKVVLAGRDPSALAAARDRIVARRAEVSVDTIAFDADAFDAHAQLVDEIFEASDVDVALVAFGVLGDQAAAEKDPHEAVAVATTNYLGAVSLLTSVANRMDEQGHGAIVVLSSVAGERGRRSNYVYGSSKAGLDTFCQGLGDRLHDRGVRVLIVRPGFVTTKMTVGRDKRPLSTSPEAVARAIVDGLRGTSDVIWVPPTLRWVMSGLRHLPRSVFRKLEI